MQVGLNPGHAGLPLDIPARSDTAAATITREGYIEDNLDGLFKAFVGPDYARHRNEYMEQLRLIYSRDAGRALLNRLDMLGKDQHVYPILDFVIPQGDDAADAPQGDGSPLVRYINRAVQVDNGLVFWDPLCLPLDPGGPDDTCQYRRMEACLIDLCCELESGGSANAREAATARIVQRDASGAAEDSAIPADPHPTASPAEGTASLSAVRPYHLPVWEGETGAVNLLGNVHIRVSEGLTALLAEIASTEPGGILFSELAQCAEKGATLLVAEGHGRSGLTVTRNGDPVWLFDEQDLARRCIQRGLATPDRPVYSAFVDLVAARDILGRKLGADFQPVSSSWMDRRAAIDRFYQCIKPDSGLHNVDRAARPRNVGGTGHAPAVQGDAYSRDMGQAAHPQDPAPSVSFNMRWLAAHGPDSSDQRPASRGADDGGGQASGASHSDSHGGQGVLRSVTRMMQSLQTRLGLRNTPRDFMEDTRAYDALVGFVPDYSIPNPYSTPPEK